MRVVGLGELPVLPINIVKFSVLGFRDVVQTIDLEIDDQTTIDCKTNLLTVAAVWAGYQSENEDILPLPCSLWDESTSYFHVSIFR